MYIHRAGYEILATVGVLLIAINLLMSRSRSGRIRTVITCLSITLYAILVQFFRSPLRQAFSDSNVVLAPASGKIITIESRTEAHDVEPQRTHIAIYLSLFNAHLNAAPVSGRVISSRYHPGQYLLAFHPKASELNERHTFVIETAHNVPVIVHLIAGTIARRIVAYVTEGQTVSQGDEIGFIKFGSRVEISIPARWEVCVEVGQHVRVGQTLLAHVR